MEEGGLDGLAVQLQLLGHDLGHRQGMDDVGLAALAALALVTALGKVVGALDVDKVRRRVIIPDGLHQAGILLLDDGVLDAALPVDLGGSVQVRRQAVIRDDLSFACHGLTPFHWGLGFSAAGGTGRQRGPPSRRGGRAAG